MTQNNTNNAAVAAPQPVECSGPPRQHESSPPTGVIQRWSRLNHFAAKARSDRSLFWAAATFAVVYNILGCIDIMSTVIGIEGNLAAEGNPFIALLMETISNGWVLVKLALQLLVTVMILWFPHRIVLGIFGISMLVTAIAVINNLHLIGVL